MKKRTWPQLIKMVHDIEKRRESVIYASDDELKKLHRITREFGRDFALTPTELYYLKQILYEGMSMRSASEIIHHDRRWILTRLEAVKQLDFHIEEREDEKKYYIKVVSDDGGLYLNYVKEEKNFTFSTKNEIATHQTQFTKQEVNSWLKATTLAIDWNKALEEVPSDEVRDD